MLNGHVQHMLRNGNTKDENGTASRIIIQYISGLHPLPAIVDHKNHHKHHLFCVSDTLPETNTAPENRLPQKESSLPTINFQVLC